MNELPRKNHHGFVLSQLVRSPPAKKKQRAAALMTAVVLPLCLVVIMNDYRTNWRSLSRQLELTAAINQERAKNISAVSEGSEEPEAEILQITSSPDDSVMNPVNDADGSTTEMLSYTISLNTNKTSTTTITTTTNTTTTSVIPNVLIAGAQKGGTTSIAHYLHEQHGACFSNPNATYAQGHGKESHFFDIPWVRKQGLAQYQSLFAHCLQNEYQSNHSNNKLLVVDGTPEFMKFPKLIWKTYEEQGTADQLKIIFTLREPVARELSWYRHRVRDCRTQDYAKSVCHKDDNNNTTTPYSFAATMQRELVPKLRHGNYRHMYGTYALYLQEWFQLFDRSRQILVLAYDEAQRDPDRFLQRIQTFLELDDDTSSSTAHGSLPRQNTATADQKQQEEPPCEVQLQLWKLFAPLNEQLYQLLEEHPGPAGIEQRPFPRFSHHCIVETDDDDNDDDVDETKSNNTTVTNHA